MDPSYNAICKPLHLNSDVAARAAEWVIGFRCSVFPEAQTAFYSSRLAMTRDMFP